MLAIILMLAGVLIVVVCMVCASKFNSPMFMYKFCYPIISIIGLMMCAAGILVLLNTEPTEEDVLNGKAEYIETLHIANGDTIKTYKREWKRRLYYNPAPSGS